MDDRDRSGGRNKVMAQSDENEKHPTKAVTDEPQEEFIQPEARPSVAEELARPERQPNDEEAR